MLACVRIRVHMCLPRVCVEEIKRCACSCEIADLFNAFSILCGDSVQLVVGVTVAAFDTPTFSNDRNCLFT